MAYDEPHDEVEMAWQYFRGVFDPRNSCEVRLIAERSRKGVRLVVLARNQSVARVAGRWNCSRPLQPAHLDDALACVLAVGQELIGRKYLDNL
jgi:hypothetical protein